MTEQVLVVKRELIEPFLKSGEGLIRENRHVLFEKILGAHLFVPRSSAEYDYNLKQVIPYVIVRWHGSLLLLRRTSKQTEKRLHNKYSLGIGGHINPSTAGDGRDVIMEGLYRELDEEVQLRDPGGLSFEGIINDESSSVSRVHLGLLYVLDVKSRDYSIIEEDKMAGQWADEEEIMAVRDRMETWSQIAFDSFVRRRGSLRGGIQ